MTREEAKQAILEHMDAIQEILDRADPYRRHPYFEAYIDRKARTKTTISFEIYHSETSLDTWIEYREDGDN